MKKIIMLLSFGVVFLLFSGCEYGLEYIDMEISQYPSRIVYISGKDQTLDLSGGIVQLKTREGSTYSIGMSEPGEFIIRHDIDFCKPGVYEIEIMRTEKLSCYFAVEVIDPTEIDW